MYAVFSLEAAVNSTSHQHAGATGMVGHDLVLEAVCLAIPAVHPQKNFYPSIVFRRICASADVQDNICYIKCARVHTEPKIAKKSESANPKCGSLLVRWKYSRCAVILF